MLGVERYRSMVFTCSLLIELCDVDLSYLVPISPLFIIWLPEYRDFSDLAVRNIALLGSRIDNHHSVYYC